MTTKNPSSEQAEQLITQMFPLNVTCCACGDEVQVNARSLSGVEPPDEEWGGCVVIPSSDRLCGSQPFCLTCAQAVRALAPEEINLAVLAWARKAALLPEQHLLDLYYAALDDEEAAVRAEDHESCDLEGTEYPPFGGEVLRLRPPAELEVTPYAKTIAHHYRVLMARYPRPPAATGLRLN